MQLNKEAFKELFIEYFQGNYNKAGRDLKVSPAQIHRIINSNSEAGLVFLSRLISYCQNNNLNYEKYIFLPKPLTVCNDKTKENG